MNNLYPFKASQRRLQRVTLQPQQTAIALHPQQLLPLTPDQKHYLINVLRLETHAEFIALDSQGGWWRSRLEPDLTTATILESIDHNSELTTYLTLGIAMPKGNNLESVVRQATELGVRQIVPLFSDRTAIKAGTEIGQQKRDRWQRIAAETAELSLRSYVPEVCAPQDVHQWLSASPHLSTCPKYICVTHPDQPHLLQCLREDQAMNSDRLMVVTGCEGGWTEREEQWAIAAGFTPVSLGDRILSAVTAPVVALSIITAYLDAL